MELGTVYAQELGKKAWFNKLEEYDVIGFDVDHCLVQYNVPNLHQMTYRALTETLITERGYPRILQDLTVEQWNFPENALICDYSTGCTLKLGENNRILRAYHGFRRLSQTEAAFLK